MPHLPRHVLACIDEAVARAGAMLDAAVARSVLCLQDDAGRRDIGDPRGQLSVAARQQIGVAVQEMRRRLPQWRSAYPSALRDALRAGPAPEPVLALHPSSLTLVDDRHITRSIEASRLGQELSARVEQPLAELDALMSAALGLEGVQPDANPLRPAAFTAPLRQVVGEGGEIEPGWPALWMRHMGAPLAEALRTLYADCTSLLAQAQVRAAPYRVLTTPVPAGASQAAPLSTFGGSASSSESGWGWGAPASQSGADAPEPLQSQPAPLLARGMGALAGLATQTVRGPALREFFARGHARGRQAPAAAYYAGVDQEIARLEASWDEAPYDRDGVQERARLAPVDRPRREVGTALPIDEQVWGELSTPRQRSLLRSRLKRDARDADQALGLEAVHQLVDQVAQDTRLLPPVREAIVALEPALLRLAMQSPRFFGEQDHAARQLVEQVALRSFKYNDEFSAPFADFFGQVSAHFKVINQQQRVEDARPFHAALQGLQAGWRQQDGAELEQRRQVVQAVELAERRQAEAEQIAWGLSQRSDLDGAPAMVQDFLFGPWSLVMAHARLHDRDHQIDPGGFVGVITDLLWTCKREETVRDPARAFDCIPRVLLTLRTGLDMIGHAPAASATFFQGLERLHRPVLRLRARHRQQALEPVSGPATLDDELRPAPPQPPQPAQGLWLAPETMDACGFEDTVPSDFAELHATEDSTPGGTTPGVAVGPVGAQAAGLVDGLRQGDWVDLYSRHQWRRAQLVWAATRGTLFMFVSHGGQPHSMTRRSLERLLANRLLRPIDGHAVVQHAMDELAKPQHVPQALAA